MANVPHAFVAPLLAEIKARNLALPSGFTSHPFNQQQYYRWLTEVVSAMPEPGLGLTAGNQVMLADLGVLGHGLLCSDSLREAFGFLLRYRDIMAPAHSLKVERQGSSTTIWMSDIEYISAALQRYEMELWLAAWQNFLATLLDSEVRFSSVLLPHSLMKHQQLYSEYFQCKIGDGGNRSGFSLPSSLWERPFKLANQEVLTFCADRCEHHLSHQQRDLPIVEKVRQMLLVGTESWPSASEVADRFHLSPRSFRRQLQQESVSYSELLMQVRRQLAEAFLAEGKLSIQQISERLGYIDPASFQKAFKQWTGQTPTQWRGCIRSPSG